MSEIVGWAGICLVLGAYFLVSFELVEATDSMYPLLNITGSAGIIISSYTKRDYQPLVLNIVWALVGILALMRLI